MIIDPKELKVNAEGFDKIVGMTQNIIHKKL